MPEAVVPPTVPAEPIPVLAIPGQAVVPSTPGQAEIPCPAPDTAPVDLGKEDPPPRHPARAPKPSSLGDRAKVCTSIRRLPRPKFYPSAHHPKKYEEDIHVIMFSKKAYAFSYSFVYLHFWTITNSYSLLLHGLSPSMQKCILLQQHLLHVFAKFLQAIYEDPTLCTRLYAEKKHDALTALEVVLLREIIAVKDIFDPFKAILGRL
ncbi:hypothetical protein DAPPUDRAFT_329175 [Daphnia pulex]|uniref:Uncharacterized protein n=1 Tax=Daphnia pulex TaxID=6669 RepID=E9HFW1_DAPPU|nr:hypothetical protein DAPPUDRAFT_329175 [Daphnia pulex]|eukprot:EFX69399.1 hypothetical protein DAPPUDRAFT_329175 [Daphnia pulex]